MTASDPFPNRDDEMTAAPNAPAAEWASDASSGTGADLEADDEHDACEDAGPSNVTLDELREELIAGSTEARRGNRRTLDVLKNFGTVLDALSATVNDTHKVVRATLPALSNRQADGGELPREWALALVELADRLERVSHGFSRPPAASSCWWPAARRALTAWRDAWAMQADALSILRSHLDVLLQRAALRRLEVVGKPFDPNTMTALESAVDPARPDHTVLAEMLPGWHHADSGQLIRPAQVRVSRSAAR